MDHFITEFKQAFSADFCQQLIEKFNSSQHKTQGKTGAGVDKSKKDSTDLYISALTEWQHECQTIQQTLMQALVQYTRRYPFLLTGPVSPSIQNPDTGEVTPIKYDQIQHYSDQQLASFLAAIYQPDDINLQFYKKSSGGYHHWHSEHFPHPKDPTQKSLHRVLLWLIYLNDVDEGGETEFFFQQTQIAPKQGSLILSPCTFTHTHRGKVPVSNDKYVLASWINYKNAAQLYGQ